MAFFGGNATGSPKGSPMKGSPTKGSPLKKGPPEKITAATGLELTPLCEGIVKLGQDQERECDDLEEDIKDMEAELADLHNDIEQDKLDCHHYEELLGQKEIELEQRAVEVEEMKKVNHQRQIDLHVRGDELDAREIKIAGKVMAPELAEHKKKMKSLKAEIREIDEAGADPGESEINVNALGALHIKHKQLRCQKQWAELESAFYSNEVSSPHPRVWTLGTLPSVLRRKGSTCGVSRRSRRDTRLVAFAVGERGEVRNLVEETGDPGVPEVSASHRPPPRSRVTHVNRPHRARSCSKLAPGKKQGQQRKEAHNF